MNFISQSPFLQALGYAISNSLWQIAVLWIIVLVVNNVCALSSKMRYWMALIGQLGGFCWFLFTLFFYYSNYRISQNFIDIKISNEQSKYLQNIINHNNDTFLLYVAKAECILHFLYIAYLVLLFCISINWIRCYANTQKIKTSGLEEVSSEWKSFIDQMSIKLQLRQYIKVFLSDVIKSPLTIGFLKPVILLPIASINHLTTEQLEAVVLHELAHIKRADYLINLIQSLIEIVLFFNPFNHLLAKLIKKEREHNCDDYVLNFKYNSTMYAEALLRLAYLQTKGMLAMQVAGDKEGDLLHRVKRILYRTDKVFNYRDKIMALFLLSVLLFSFVCFQPIFLKNIHSPKSTNTSYIISKPFSATAGDSNIHISSFLNQPIIADEKNTPTIIVKKINKNSVNKDHFDFTFIAPNRIEKSIPIQPEFVENFFENTFDESIAEIKEVNEENKIENELLITKHIMNNQFKNLSPRKLAEPFLNKAFLQLFGTIQDKTDLQNTDANELISYLSPTYINLIELKERIHIISDDLDNSVDDSNEKAVELTIEIN